MVTTIKPQGLPTHRPLSVIAEDIELDWQKVSPYAKPYLQAMFTLDQITGVYGVDSASYIVNYFLANAQGWRGDKARSIKAELKDIIKLLDSSEQLQNLARASVDRAYRRP